MHRIGPATLKGTHRLVCSYRLSQIRRSRTSAPAAVQAGTPGTPAGVPSLCRSLFRLRFRRRRDTSWLHGGHTGVNRSRWKGRAGQGKKKSPQSLRTRRPRKQKYVTTKSPCGNVTSKQIDASSIKCYQTLTKICRSRAAFGRYLSTVDSFWK